MKKYFHIFMLLLAIITLNSCFSEAQVVYSGEYYDKMSKITVVYRDNIPYYRVWRGDCWNYRIVPIERRTYIRYRPRPIPPHNTSLYEHKRVRPLRHGNTQPNFNRPTNNRHINQPNRGRQKR